MTSAHEAAWLAGCAHHFNRQRPRVPCRGLLPLAGVLVTVCCTIFEHGTPDRYTFAPGGCIGERRSDRRQLAVLAKLTQPQRIRRDPRG